MRKKSIFCKTFSHNGNTVSKPEEIYQCPFHFMRNVEHMACRLLSTEEYQGCQYESGNDIPENCPLRKGSVTRIFYMDKTLTKEEKIEQWKTDSK